MKISNIAIKKVIPKNGLIGFASCVIDDSLFLGNIAIFSKLDKPEELRLVFPIKEIERAIEDGSIAKTRISIFKPLTADFYYLLEKAITEKFKQND